jgi:hypothetical protein
LPRLGLLHQNLEVLSFARHRKHRAADIHRERLNMGRPNPELDASTGNGRSAICRPPDHAELIGLLAD